MSVLDRNVQDGMYSCLMQLFEDQKIFEKVFELFPYPVQIFSVDGTSRMINNAAL